MRESWPSAASKYTPLTATTLRLNYNPAADGRIADGQGADGNELVQYAQKSLDNLPEAGNMFPGLNEIVVDFGSL